MPHSVSPRGAGRPRCSPRRTVRAHSSPPWTCADAEQIEIGWWPGDARYPRAAFFGFVSPAPPGLSEATVAPAAARWDTELGEFLLDWDDARAADDPAGAAIDFGRSVIRHA